MHEQALISRRRLTAALPLAAIAGTRSTAAAGLFATVGVDPVFAEIELHKALRTHINNVSWLDEDARSHAACAEEEAATELLGEMMPTTIAGAAAQLRYVVEVEKPFADEQSPLARCVLAARSLWPKLFRHERDILTFPRRSRIQALLPRQRRRGNSDNLRDVLSRTLDLVT